MNTAKQMIWLPTSREEKYKAKQAIDTFFVRDGRHARRRCRLRRHAPRPPGRARVRALQHALRRPGPRSSRCCSLREYRRLTAPALPAPARGWLPRERRMSRSSVDCLLAAGLLVRRARQPRSGLAAAQAAPGGGCERGEAGDPDGRRGQGVRPGRQVALLVRGRLPQGLDDARRAAGARPQDRGRRPHAAAPGRGLPDGRPGHEGRERPRLHVPQAREAPRARAAEGVAGQRAARPSRSTRPRRRTRRPRRSSARSRSRSGSTSTARGWR